ncbi:MAG: hypothetical protein WC438_05770 [Candidatus Pacearchaeota archaeon]|jgi:ABC-type uncharacterized transport system ATPase subunit
MKTEKTSININKEAFEILENEFSETPKEFVEIIDMSNFKYPLIKKVNYATGAFKDVYIKIME